MPFIPPDLLRAMMDFAGSARNGRIVLDIVDGKITSGDMTRKFRVKDGALQDDRLWESDKRRARRALTKDM